MAFFFDVRRVPERNARGIIHKLGKGRLLGMRRLSLPDLSRLYGQWFEPDGQNFFCHSPGMRFIIGYFFHLFDVRRVPERNARGIIHKPGKGLLLGIAHAQ